MENERLRALDKALEKVEYQQRRLAMFALDDPYRKVEQKVLETLRQSASLARMACIFSDVEASSSLH